MLNVDNTQNKGYIMKVIYALLATLVLVSCSETEHQEILSGNQAPPQGRQFLDVEHSILASKIDAVLEAVTTNPAEKCELYESWIGDWISDEIIIEGWRSGYRFNDDGTYQELSNLGWGWVVSDGGEYYACDKTYGIIENFGVGNWWTTTGRWSIGRGTLRLTGDDGDVENLTKLVID